MDERSSTEPASGPAAGPAPASVPAPSSGADGRGVPRSVIVVGLAIVGLVLVALVVALAAPVRPTVYAPGTPEAAFQDFYSAWEDRDFDTAYAALSTTVRRDLTLADYRRMDSEMTWLRDEDRRVVLLAARITGDRALLDLRIDQFSGGGGLGGERYSWERSVNLVREDGAWRIDEGLLGVETVAYPAKY